MDLNIGKHISGQFNDELVMLLDANALYPEPAIKDLYPAELIDRCDFVSQAEPEIRAIFAERRQRYKTLAVGGESEEKKEIMIVTIGTERFGLDMPEIKEVADIGDVIKIPCCPSHVLGNMNLRGDIVTVFSLARLLGQAQPLIDNDGKLIVYEHESLLLAILVDNIVDVMFIDTEQILPPPLALDKIKSGYIAGEILLESVVVSLLDIRQIIHQDELVVDDSD